MRIGVKTDLNNYCRKLALRNCFLSMPQAEFDAIIDDCFLDGAARVRAKKYETRTNPRAARIILEMWKQEKTNIRAA